MRRATITSPAVCLLRGAFCIVLCILLFGVALISAQDLEHASFPPQFSGTVGQPLPNAVLPKHVSAPDGKLTLFAEFSSIGAKGVPLYLVNRTGKPILFRAQDHDIYVKLEHRRFDGTWERAQPHRDPDCGLSHTQEELPSGQHFAFFGYMPRNGIRTKVRFASFGNSEIVSNTGEGFVLAADIEAARRDGTATRQVPWALSRVLLENRPGRPGLEPSPSEIVAALRLVHSLQDSKPHREAAEEYAKKIEKNRSASDTEREAAKAIRSILEGPWPRQRDARRFRERCLQALKAGPQPGADFGMPENEPALVWRAVCEFASMVAYPRTELAAREWEPFLALANDPEVIRKLGGYPAAKLIAIPEVADELLGNEFFEEILLKEEPELRNLGAETLARRGEWDRLANLGWKLPPEDQIMVLKALTYPPWPTFGVPRRRESEAEARFWRHCATTQPLETVNAVAPGGFNSDELSYATREPLRAYLAELAAKECGPGDEFRLQRSDKRWSAVELLGSWGQEVDTKLLKQFLTHRGFEEERVVRFQEKQGAETVRRYPVRQAARRALFKLEIPVPEDVVVEKVVGP